VQLKASAIKKNWQYFRSLSKCWSLSTITHQVSATLHIMSCHIAQQVVPGRSVLAGAEIQGAWRNKTDKQQQQQGQRLGALYAT
jgi:hypothetical protein